MQKKITIGFAVLLLLAVVFFMARDLFQVKNSNSENIYEYKLDNLKEIDPKLISHKTTKKAFIEEGKLRAICIDSKDRIFVVAGDQVLQFNTDLKKVNSFKTGKKAHCITSTNDDKLILGMHNHIEIFNLEGKIISIWDTLNARVVITSITADENSVYAADAGNKIVYRYNHQGELQNTIGEKNKERGIRGFVIPSPYFDLLLGRESELWVVNPGHHAFEQYDKTGDLKSSWEKTSMQLEGFSGCCNPSHIAMLSDGSFVTSEKGLERVKIHTPNGIFKSVVAAPSNFEDGTKGIDIAVDSKDRIYIIDPKKGEIKRFERK